MRKLLILTIFLSLFPLSFSFAASLNDSNPDQLSIEMIPSIPSANQNILVRLTSYVTDINAAKITWSVNGKVVQSGVGLKNFNFKTGEFNTETNLQIDVTTNEGGQIHQNIRVRPTDVDLVWEAETYVPPLYKGKALFTHQSKIKFIATPHVTDSAGKEVSPSKMVYHWSVNGSAKEEASGYGKNTYTMIGSIISRTLDVTVNVTDPSTGTSGIGNSTAEPLEPSILVYKKDPLYGIEFQKAIVGTWNLKDFKEVTLIAVPMFFGVDKSYSERLNYKWSLNGKKINNLDNAYAQVFRRNDNSGGSANIALSIEYPEKVLQLVDTRFTLMFDEIKNSDNSI